MSTNSFRPAAAFVEREAPAKINWFLEILRKREDGFHEIRTVMQAIDWSDTLRCYPTSESALTLSSDAAGLPLDERNLVVKAAMALREHAGRPDLGARMELDKRVPWGGGLGGGSSDAAAALDALNTLWELELPHKTLAELAADLGSDVAFFLDGPVALCEGRGEEVTPLESAPTTWLVLIWPGMEVSTPAIYRSGRIDLTQPRQFRYLKRTESDSTGHRRIPYDLFNRLQEACFACFPQVESCFDIVAQIAGDRPASLSGSGSSMFVVCHDENDGRMLERQLNSTFPSPARVRLTRTLPEAATTTWRFP